MCGTVLTVTELGIMLKCAFLSAICYLMFLREQNAIDLISLFLSLVKAGPSPSSSVLLQNPADPVFQHVRSGEGKPLAAGSITSSSLFFGFPRPVPPWCTLHSFKTAHKSLPWKSGECKINWEGYRGSVLRASHKWILTIKAQCFLRVTN